jgi:SAM-dependent methyltransferase
VSQGSPPLGEAAGVTGLAPSVPASTRTLESCLACGGREVGRLALRYEHRGVTYPLMECAGCGMRFLGVQPQGAALEALYAEPYFEADYRCGRSASSSFDERPFLAENQGLLDAFASLIPPGRLLDVGCASGWLLKHAAERGWRAAGVEPSKPAAEFARSLGLDVRHGDLPAARFEPGCFDLVFMGDVLEHVPDCRATLLEVARVLAPGGFLYLRGPITTHSLARGLGLALYRGLGRDIVLREPPYHLWEFTPGSLRRLAEAAGLEVVRLRQSKIPPGRVRGEKSPWQRAAIVALDALNAPLTLAFNVLGDRVVLVARKPMP